MISWCVLKWCAPKKGGGRAEGSCSAAAVLWRRRRRVWYRLAPPSAPDTTMAGMISRMMPQCCARTTPRHLGRRWELSDEQGGAGRRQRGAVDRASLTAGLPALPRSRRCARAASRALACAAPALTGCCANARPRRPANPRQQQRRARLRAPRQCARRHAPARCRQRPSMDRKKQEALHPSAGVQAVRGGALVAWAWARQVR